MVLIPVESVGTRPPPPVLRCELCAEALPERHRHLLDPAARTLCCACRACALLFERPGGRYRSVPQRRRRLPAEVLDGAAWARLRIPVRMAFPFYDTAAGRPVAFYPSPAGAVEADLPPVEWDRIVAGYPALAGLAPDVEAVLVDRSDSGEGSGEDSGSGEVFLVPIDDCYALVGLVRAHWQGLTGGRRRWQRVAELFADLRAHAPAGDRCEPAGAGTEERAAGQAGADMAGADPAGAGEGG